MKLYACLGSGNCMKPWLAMHQVHQDFELSLIDVLKGEQKTDAYLAINPLGTVPYLITDGGTGIGESNAMLWYICDSTDLMPADPAERAEALQWLFFEQTTLEPYISSARFFTHIAPKQFEAKADDVAEWQMKASSGLKRLNAHLAERTFMLRSGYSVADIGVFGYVHVLEEAGLDGRDFPHIMRWINKVKATPDFKALDRLGKVSTKAA